MPSLRDVKARIGAARLVLARPMSSEAFRSISANQKAAVLEVIRHVKTSCTASASELAELATVVVEVNFAPGDLEEVLAELSGVRPASPTLKKRRGQQDYLNILHFGTAALWQSLASPGHL